jgi:hypothetical protein
MIDFSKSLPLRKKIQFFLLQERKRRWNKMKVVCRKSSTDNYHKISTRHVSLQTSSRSQKIFALVQRKPSESRKQDNLFGRTFGTHLLLSYFISCCDSFLQMLYTQHRETASDFIFYFIFISWPSGGYIPVNLGNSKRRPKPAPLV